MPDKSKDIIRRGEYGFDRAGAAVFCVGRGLDPLLQRFILQTSPLDALFNNVGSDPHPNITKAHPSHPVPRHSHPTASTLGFNFSPNFYFDLGLTQQESIVWGMSVLSAVKQIYAFLYTGNEIMAPSTSAMVVAFNTVMNSINTLLFTISAANPTYSDPVSLYVGAGLFAVGILAEPLAETQRKFFKDRQAKTGKATNPKPYTGGLFGLARNINYGAYTVWRTGFALATGGWVWGAIVASFFTWSFAGDRVPLLESYMKEKYGEEQWAAVEKEVPYRLFPGIY